MSDPIKGKVFLITGGAAGVGAGIVRQLLEEDAQHVVFLDVAQREGATLEQEVTNKFGALRAKFIKCDVAKEDQLSEAYRQVLDKYRRLDVVINNAGIVRDDDETHRRMIDVNFAATVSSTLKAMDVMRSNSETGGGIVINISSLLALSRSERLPVYSATKAAVMQFSNCVGMDPYFSRTNIKVITVCFGPTDTAILQRNISVDKENDNIVSRVLDRQTVKSAATGVLHVIRQAQSGSTWMIADNKPAVDITDIIKKGFDLISNALSV